MSVSVIIPTFNGKENLLNVLDRLNKQDLIPNEVIVVIDGSTDGSIAAIQNMIPNVSNLKVLFQENQGRSSAKHNGALVAKSEIFVFVDDDMLIETDFVSRHNSAARKYGIVTGTLYAARATSCTSCLYEYSCYLGKKWENCVKEQDTPYITANSFSIKKDIYFEIGGFRPGLRDAEDQDLAKRAHSMGYRPYLDSSIRSGHLIKGSLRDYVTRYQSYLLCSDAQPDTFVRKAKFYFLFSIILPLIRRTFPARTFLGSLLDEKHQYLPPLLRFRLYNFIITYYRHLNLSKI
jgi:glycosyltransferase involved in cell wall biosynthesis